MITKDRKEGFGYFCLKTFVPSVLLSFFVNFVSSIRKMDALWRTLQEIRLSRQNDLLPLERGSIEVGVMAASLGAPLSRPFPIKGKGVESHVRRRHIFSTPLDVRSS
jgi:hypothetical protein